MATEESGQGTARATDGNARTAKVMGLFLAAVLVSFTPGCGSGDGVPQAQHEHYDKDGDGYCDLDGQIMPDRGHGGGRYYGLPHYYSGQSAQAPSPTAGSISSGAAAPKGGIGSHSVGSSG